MACYIKRNRQRFISFLYGMVAFSIFAKIYEYFLNRVYFMCGQGSSNNKEEDKWKRNL